MSTQTAWQYPADLIEVATKAGVLQYVDPLREMTQRLFPTATSITVFQEPDPEMRDVTFIVFEVNVPRGDVPDYVEANHRWTDEFMHIYPYPRLFPFVLTLNRDP